jgi:hypothetical protein
MKQNGTYFLRHGRAGLEDYKQQNPSTLVASKSGEVFKRLIPPNVPHVAALATHAVSAEPAQPSQPNQPSQPSQREQPEQLPAKASNSNDSSKDTGEAQVQAVVESLSDPCAAPADRQCDPPAAVSSSREQHGTKADIGDNTSADAAQVASSHELKGEG